MTIDAAALLTLIEAELATLSDSRIAAHIRTLLVMPVPVMRGWDYGRDGEQYPCWTVLEHAASNTGLAYCEHGFGPRSPWGLVFLKGDESQTSIGMDCSWFTTFLQAFFESMAAKELPIWRVFSTDSAGRTQPISDEGGWDETWSRVLTLRKSDSAHRYDCGNSIPYERE